VEDLVANLNTEQLRRLARLGAIARLEQLKEEEAAIRAEFPELFGRGRRAAVADGAKPGRRRGRRKMSSAARKAVSERMRKYWAERRKGKGK
jgi:Micro-tubular organiser Mto1 C-term Mto2-binding region